MSAETDLSVAGVASSCTLPWYSGTIGKAAAPANLGSFVLGLLVGFAERKDYTRWGMYREAFAETAPQQAVAVALFLEDPVCRKDSSSSGFVASSPFQS